MISWRTNDRGAKLSELKIDVFALAVPVANKGKFIAHAITGADLFKKLDTTRLVKT